MRKKKNTKSQKTNKTADWAVTILCLLGAFFSFWLFWQDLGRTLSRNQAPVGTITFKQRAAQRRLGDRVLWDQLRRDSPVYNGDYIRTAELSDATVTFNEGAQFSLAENTLIQIHSVNGRSVLDLSSGDISVKNPGPFVFVLVSGDKEVELSGTVRASAASNGSFDLEVLEGNAVIKQGNKEIRREAGQALSFSPDGEVEARSQVIMLLPRPDERFAGSAEPLGINFSWTPVNFTEAEHTRLEIASDRRFTRLVKTFDIETSSTVVELPSGVYWWRAYPSGAAGGNFEPSVRAGSTAIPGVFPAKLTIVQPESAGSALIIPPLPERTVIAGPEKTPAALRAPAAAVPARRPSPLPPAKPPPVPPAVRPPAALLPAAAEQLPENNYIIGPAYLRKSRNLTFSWKEVEGANAYIFTLRDAMGREILNTGAQTETSYTLDLRGIKEGSFIWQVEPVRRNREIIEQRGIVVENRFTVDIPLPDNPQVRDTGILYGSEP
jgi:hypothetical protein